MPIYEFQCSDCGKVSEVLMLRKDEEVRCGGCGSTALVKLMSAPNISVPGGGSSGALCGGSAMPDTCGMTSSCGAMGGG